MNTINPNHLHSFTRIVPTIKSADVSEQNYTRGYKKAIYTVTGEEVMVILLITGHNNEGRAGIFNEKYAKYRCSKAFVVSIKDMKNKTHIPFAVSFYNPSFIYMPRTEIEDPSYDPDINNIYGSGIYYYKSKIPAFFCNYGKYRFDYYALRIGYNGNCIEFYSDGKTAACGEYMDGKRCGIWKLFYTGGDLHGIEFYSNGMPICCKRYPNDDVDMSHIWEDKCQYGFIVYKDDNKLHSFGKS